MNKTVFFQLKTTGGFTLLELLLVVFILSTIAAMTASFVNNADEQFRYEETQRHLLNIRRAIIGDFDTSYHGERLLSGFVVENGALPDTIQALTQRLGGFDVYGLKDPLFDPTPDALEGFNNGGEITLTGSSERLFKGHRGSYLSMQPGSSEYRDGWGNGASGDVNFGWSVTATPTDFTATTLGADGQAGGAGYDSDISDAIQQSNWSADAAGWQVTVTNRSGSDITGRLRVSLLTYVKRSGLNPGWKRLTSDSIAALANNASAVFTFPDALLAIPTRIPMGQHLLILIQDNDGVPHNSDDAPYVSAGNRVVRTVNWYPHAVRPVVEMVIQ
ncbi:MAG: type II secretion system protein [Deltaproteobacteria bacterium]|nr:type II secretion system protein [Deltaproteobacteria bacterium]